MLLEIGGENEEEGKLNAEAGKKFEVVGITEVSLPLDGLAVEELEEAPGLEDHAGKEEELEGRHDCRISFQKPYEYCSGILRRRSGRGLVDSIICALSGRLRSV